MIPEAVGDVPNTVGVRSTGRIDQAVARSAADMGWNVLGEVGGNVTDSKNARILMERIGSVVRKTDCRCVLVRDGFAPGDSTGAENERMT